MSAHPSRHLRPAVLALLLSLALSVQAQTFTRTIDGLVEVGSGAPHFGTYLLPVGESLHITRDGELNAPLDASGHSIVLLDRVFNEGRLRAGHGIERRGLHIGGKLENQWGSFNQPAGLIEAMSLTVRAGGELFNGGLLFTGSHTYPAGRPYATALRLALQDGGVALPETGFAIVGYAENGLTGTWTSHANGLITGTLVNHGVFFSESSPWVDTLAQPGTAPYLKTITVGDPGSVVAQGRILNNGGLLLDAHTLVRNAGSIENRAGILLEGQLELVGGGQLRNEAGARFALDGSLTVTRFNLGGLANRGEIEIGRGGRLANHGQVVNDPAGILRVQQGGSIGQGDAGVLMNQGLLNARGIVTGGTIVQDGGRLQVGEGGFVSVQQVQGGSIVNDGGQVQVGRDATLSVQSFLQTGGQLTVNGTLQMLGTEELRILGGVLDGGGTLNPVTGTVDGGGTINGDLFLSGIGGGPVQQPPYCFATGWACFRPGNSPGAVQINGDLTLGDNAVLQLEIERDASGVLQWDTVLATTMHFGAGSVIELTLGAGVDTGGLPLDLLRCDAGCSFDGSFHVLGGSGQFVADAGGLRFSGVSAVPEPGTWALLAAGLAVCALRARVARQAEGARQA